MITLLCIGILLVAASLTPVAGKVGRFQTNISSTAVNHEFTNFELNLKAEQIECDGYEKTPDDDGNAWHGYLTCLAGGDWSGGGFWNTAKSPMASFHPGSAGPGSGTPVAYSSLYLGITNTIGFTITGPCESVVASSDVSKGQMFKANGKVTGVTTYPS
jgi:hypothetical protein